MFTKKLTLLVAAFAACVLAAPANALATDFFVDKGESVPDELSSSAIPA